MKNILFLASAGEENYIPLLKPSLSGRAQVHLRNITPTAIMEVAMIAKQKDAKYVITTSQPLLRMFLDKGGTIDDYSGSIFEKYGVEFLFVNPLEQLVTVSHGRHIFDRYASKFLHPENWLEIPEFTWELFNPAKMEEYLAIWESATFISADIETGREDDKVITCLGSTAVHIDPVARSFTARTIVIPFNELFNVVFARKLLRSPAPKAFQNGKYDNAYLLRYNVPVTNWALDTINMFHSWYSELPKDLGSINAYLLRNWQFHKGESKTTDLMTYYRYNAKDSFSTAMSVLALLRELPPYAIANFLQEFPLVFPCVLAEATGIRADRAALAPLSEQFNKSAEARKARIRKMVANPFYNPGSPPQTAKVFKMLGCGDLNGTGKIPMDKAMNRHPLNKKILGDIKSYREDKKLVSNYLDESKIWNGRWYYALNPHGTDTGRLASKESHFWCGLQIQNIPRDRDDVQVKDAYISDSGFYFGEADGEQAEARDTAYLSGDTNLISAVEDHTRDFHGLNAAAFFGLPYDAIVKSYENNLRQWIHKTIDKAIRDLSKRTNHGANYNMGQDVMVDTMGVANVLRAKKLLKLPESWTLRQVTAYLLDRYAKTYPVVKGPWYDKCKNDVDTTKLLIGPTGWTRYCFGSPSKNKRDLNRYVAHPPQSLNAMVLNKAWLSIFYNVWLPNQEDFKLHAQIHDSILFSYRIGRQDLARQVKKLMEIPVEVTDTFGIKRTLIVPVALKGEETRWSKLIPEHEWKLSEECEQIS